MQSGILSLQTEFRNNDAETPTWSRKEMSDFLTTSYFD